MTFRGMEKLCSIALFGVRGYVITDHARRKGGGGRVINKGISSVVSTEKKGRVLMRYLGNLQLSTSVQKVRGTS